MKIHIFATLLFISCIPFAIQARLLIKNNSGKTIDIAAGGFARAKVLNGDNKDYDTTPKTLSIKKEGSIWVPLELYLLKMHTQKKGLADTKGKYRLYGILTVNESGVTTGIAHLDTRGNTE